MRGMHIIAQHQLQAVLTAGQINCNFGLSTAEMNMLLITGQPVFAFSVPAGATPMPDRPKFMVNGVEIRSPSIKFTK